MRGVALSEEHKKKLSEALKGKRPKNLESLYTPELNKKRSIALSGEKSPHWKGGVTPINEMIRKSLEYRLWREAVFKRDNYTCTWCGDKTSGNLNADHIKQFAYFPELRFAIDNGRTLCRECHKKTSTYGNNRGY